jgi:2-(1,2-epoxy-1,2-dihydrophenyl)acetyl-CoA isomerase
MSDKLLFEQAGSIGTLTFNRPDVFNAMNDEIIFALRDVTSELVNSTSLRALIICGAGSAFIAGGDVGYFYERRDTVANEVRASIDALHASIMSIRNMPFPVIARIQGAVAGAGVSLAMACDFAVAADTAHFTTAYSKIGLSPDGGSTYFLPRVVGMKKAAELIMLSDTVNAEAALEMGLVNRVVPLDQLEAETQKLATRLANGATLAFAGAKRLITASTSNNLETQLAAERESFATCAATSDFREGVTAFVEKRKPVFSGK